MVGKIYCNNNQNKFHNSILKYIYVYVIHLYTRIGLYLSFEQEIMTIQGIQKNIYIDPTHKLKLTL